MGYNHSGSLTLRVTKCDHKSTRMNKNQDYTSKLKFDHWICSITSRYFELTLRYHIEYRWKFSFSIYMCKCDNEREIGK